MRGTGEGTYAQEGGQVTPDIEGAHAMHERQIRHVDDVHAIEICGRGPYAKGPYANQDPLTSLA